MKTQGIIKKLLCFAFAAALVLGTAMPTFAEEISLADGEDTEILDEPQLPESDSVITSYTVTDPLGVPKVKVVKGDKVNISVNVRNLALTVHELAGGIDVVRPIDSFNGSGNPSVAIKSAKTSALEYVLTFTGLTYSGDGQTLNVILTYPGLSIAKETLSLTVKECVEYVEPSTAEPTQPAVDTQAPMVIISRGALPQSLKAGDVCTMSVTIQNLSTKTAIGSGIVSFEPSEGLTLVENSSSKTVGAILPGLTQVIAVKIMVEKGVESAAQSVSVSYKYNYKVGDGTTAQETAAEKLNVPVILNEKATQAQSASAAAPNIIISSYSYGKPVAAGESFTLRLAFKNTSAGTKIDNIVMSVETGAALSIVSSSNTYYYKSLAAAKTQGQSIDMKALANGELTGGTVSITFSYEYVQGGERQTKTSSESLSVPLFLPDRFSIAPPEAQYATSGEECYVSLNYVNKGKGAVSNVEAELIYGEDELYCELPHQNLGNYEPGASGTIDFVFTPNAAGELKLTAKVTYEDEMQETKTLEIPITLTVEDAVPVDDIGGEDIGGEGEETAGMSKVVKIGIIAGSVVLAAIIATVVIVVLKKKKKAKAQNIPDDFNWDTENAADAAETVTEVHGDENP